MNWRCLPLKEHHNNDKQILINSLELNNKIKLQEKSEVSKS